MDSFLVNFVEAKLGLKWTPKSISGYLKRELGITCSAKAIYKYIEHRGLEYRLFWWWNKKRGGPKRQKHKEIPDNRKYIEQRPDTTNQVGHYELDFIISKHSTYVLLVATDRLTKHSLVRRLPNRKRSTVRQAFSGMFGGVTVKSITTDNDIAFRHWSELEDIIQAPIYFCHPYHSWEKGLVENTNRWIRCFVPKRRDIASVTQEDLDEIHAFLNDRPRECLNFRIPSVYYYEMSVLVEG
jgi:IS30 family transposase